ALLMMNGRDINGQIRSDKTRGLVADIVNRNTRGGTTNVTAVYNELFLMTVSRRPTQEERTKLEEVRLGKARINLGAPMPNPKGPKPKGPVGTPVPGAFANDVTFYEDVLWALLNTNEFMLNH
ncbi:MAG: hypothetical protein L0241_21490, partial [Planctomycetia bacterium]|nr:hypothetical protein [Planctomycetia bacterium]